MDSMLFWDCAHDKECQALYFNSVSKFSIFTIGIDTLLKIQFIYIAFLREHKAEGLGAQPMVNDLSGTRSKSTQVRASGFNNFWKVLCCQYEYAKTVYSYFKRGTKHSFEIVNLFAKGGGSLVYHTRNSTEFPKRNLVVKFYQSDDDFRSERNIFIKLEENENKNMFLLPLAESREDSINKWILIPAGLIVSSKWRCLDKWVAPLEYNHFSQLLTQIVTFHQAGFVHRDLRANNVVIYNGEAKIIDFAFAQPIGEKSKYCGSYETASQRVLLMQLNGYDAFIFSPIDDLESLYKLFLLWSWNQEFPYDPNHSRTKQSYHFWKIKMAPYIRDVEKGNGHEDEWKVKYIKAYEFLKSQFSEKYDRNYEKFKEIEGI